MSSLPTHGLRRVQLANGVTLLVQRRASAPALSLVAHVRAGFLDEPDDTVGISHVLEHMLFKGTPTLGPGELAQRTKALGGSLNAYTAYDRTVYYASAPARHAAELIALQADQVQRPLLDADELRRELQVIIQEARRKLDSPGAVAGETLHELLFATHRIRRWRIGIDVDLERLTRDDVVGYWGSRYVPSRVIVALVGDVDEEFAIAALTREWGAWSRPAVEIASGPGESTAPAHAARSLHGDVSRSELVLGWRAPGVLDDHIPALDMAAAILAAGRGSRLGRALRDTGLVSGLGADTYGVVDAGVFAIGAELDAARMTQVLSIIGGIIEDLARHPVDVEEFTRARTLLRAGLGRRLERYESRATALAAAESLGDVTRLDREESDLLAVTPDAVRTAVARYLPLDVMSAVAYLPRDGAVVFDVGAVNRAMAAARAHGQLRRDAPIAPTAHRLRGAVVHHLALPATDILTARFGDTGQVSLNVYRMRDTLESAVTAGLSLLASRAMVRGTVRLDAAALAFAFESMGGSVSSSVGADVIGFGAGVLGEHAMTAMQLLLEVVHQPRFAPETVATERALLLDDALAVADDMVRFPMQLLLGTAFGDAGYGAPSHGTPASVASLTDENVRAWHATMSSGGRTTIIAVGDIDPVRLAEQIAVAVTAAGQPGDSSRSTIPPGAVIMPGVRVEHRDRQQSALAMLFPGPSRRDPQRFAAEVWSAIAGGLGGRLFESLRSARSLAYTVIANSWQRQRAGGLLTYIACDPGRFEEARDAMLEELATFRREPPSAAEVSRAVASLVGEIEMSPQTSAALAGEIADAWLLGNGLDELVDPAAPYRAVTAEAVHQLASAFDPARRAEGVVTPAAE